MEITRRGFAKFIGGIAGLAGADAEYTKDKGEYNPTSHFIRLNSEFRSADEVASAFAEADSAFLMASYAVFFPEFLRLHSYEDAVGSLERAAELQRRKHDANRHRLDALPSVAAAHLLQCAKETRTRHFLSNEISKGLKDHRREVREIIIQNLITSATANFDSVASFAVETTLIHQLGDIIGEANDNDKLLTPAMHAIEFLLNARSLLCARNYSRKELQHFNHAIGIAEHSKAPHMSYLQRLIKIHENTFKARSNNIASLPPQSSEALIGWEKLTQARDYLGMLAIVRARLAYATFGVMSGAVPADAAMSAREAEVALPKSIGFFKAFNLSALLSDSGSELVGKEPKFANFVRSEFPALLKNPQHFGTSSELISAEMIQLGTCVPFARYEDRGILQAAVQEQNERDRKALYSMLACGCMAAPAAIDIASWVAELFSRRKARIRTRGGPCQSGYPRKGNRSRIIRRS